MGFRLVLVLWMCDLGLVFVLRGRSSGWIKLGLGIWLELILGLRLGF